MDSLKIPKLNNQDAVDNSFAIELQELSWYLRDVESGRTTIDLNKLQEVCNALEKSAKIMSVLEIRLKSLNSIRAEFDKYTDEYNNLIN